jgi:hypothetical protein
VLGLAPARRDREGQEEDGAGVGPESEDEVVVVVGLYSGAVVVVVVVGWPFPALDALELLESPAPLEQWLWPFPHFWEVLAWEG